MRMNETAYVIGKFLVAESVVEGKDRDEWNGIVDTFVPQLLKVRKMELLSAPTRLAIAISIIGAGRQELLTIAFRLLCDWEYVGGPFWIVQEEILRFATIHLFKCEIDKNNSEKSVTTTNIRKKIPDILPNDLPDYITHKIVIKRIHVLRTEFEWLLDDIRRGSAGKAKLILQEYSDRFPLDNFTKWFVKWAQKLLVNFEALSLGSSKGFPMCVEMCRNNIQSYSGPENQLVGTDTPGPSKGYGKQMLHLNLTDEAKISDGATPKSKKRSHDTMDYDNDCARRQIFGSGGNELWKTNELFQGQNLTTDLEEDSWIPLEVATQPKIDFMGEQGPIKMSHKVGPVVGPSNGKYTLRSNDDHILKIVVPSIKPISIRPVRAVTVEKYFANRAENDTGTSGFIKTYHSFIKRTPTRISSALEFNQSEIKCNDNTELYRKDDLSTPIPTSYDIDRAGSKNIDNYPNVKLSEADLHSESGQCEPSRNDQKTNHNGRNTATFDPDHIESFEHDHKRSRSPSPLSEETQYSPGDDAPKIEGSGSSNLAPDKAPTASEEEIEFYESASDVYSAGSDGGGIVNTFTKSVWGIFSPSSQ